MTVAPEPRATLDLLIDTNVVLDVVLGREPWAREAALLFNEIVAGKARGFLAAHALTTVHYIVASERDRSAASTAVADVLSVFAVVPLEAAEFQRALALRLGDFEDAVQVAACLKVGARFIVTRNARDFRGAPVETRTPGEVVALLAAATDPPA